jgi:hypothetical protein
MTKRCDHLADTLAGAILKVAGHCHRPLKIGSKVVVS